MDKVIKGGVIILVIAAVIACLYYYIVNSNITFDFNVLLIMGFFYLLLK